MALSDKLLLEGMFRISMSIINLNGANHCFKLLRLRRFWINLNIIINNNWT
jgi:hypothetical protein